MEPDRPKEENVIADYVEDLNLIQMEGQEMAVKKARNALFWAGGLIFLGEMLSMGISDEGFHPLGVVIAAIEAGIFVALAFWTKTKPYTAVLIGLILFLVLIVGSAVILGIEQGPKGIFKALFSGIIVKVLILVNLIRPLGDARELQRAKEERARLNLK